MAFISAPNPVLTVKWCFQMIHPIWKQQISYFNFWEYCVLKAKGHNKQRQKIQILAWKIGIKNQLAEKPILPYNICPLKNKSSDYLFGILQY